MDVTVVWQQVLYVTVGSSLQDRRMCVRLYHRVRPRCWGGDLSGGDLSPISPDRVVGDTTRCVCVTAVCVSYRMSAWVSACVATASRMVLTEFERGRCIRYRPYVVVYPVAVGWTWNCFTDLPLIFSNTSRRIWHCAINLCMSAAMCVVSVAVKRRFYCSVFRDESEQRTGLFVYT